MSLLVVVFFLELVLYLISTVGAKPANELVCIVCDKSEFLLTLDSYGSYGRERPLELPETSRTRFVYDETWSA